MARAYGSSATLLLKRETAYGQAASGDYIRMPFNRCSLGAEQGLIDDPVLGQGRDPLAPLRDVINDEGELVVPMDTRYVGLWLTGLFGGPATTDNLDGTYDHVFASGSRGTATSAIWKVTYRPWATTLAPILTSFSRIVVSDQCSISFGNASVRMKLARL